MKAAPVTKFEKPVVPKRVAFYALVEVPGGGFQVFEKWDTTEGAKAIDSPDVRPIAMHQVLKRWASQ